MLFFTDWIKLYPHTFLGHIELKYFHIRRPSSSVGWVPLEFRDSYRLCSLNQHSQLLSHAYRLCSKLST